MLLTQRMLKGLLWDPLQALSHTLSFGQVQLAI